MPLSNLLRSERTNLPWCGSWRFWFGLCCILNDDSVPMSILGLEACHGLGSFEFVRVEIDRFFCWNWHFNPGQMMVEYPALRIQWLEPIFPMQMAISIGVTNPLSFGCFVQGDPSDQHSQFKVYRGQTMLLKWRVLKLPPESQLGMCKIPWFFHCFEVSSPFCTSEIPLFSSFFHHFEPSLSA